MASHWAIVIGVSEYIGMEPLPYAKRDAHAMQKFFTEDVKFDQVFYFTDESPDITLAEGITLSTQPTFTDLKYFFQTRFATPFLQPDDTLWLFFSGHGWHYGNQDYLLPSDANPEQPESTAIAIDDIADCLKNSGTERIVMLLDACHTKEQQFGQGFGTDPEGVITLFATDYNQIAAEVPPLLGIGMFTYVLLEGLRALTDFRNANLDHLYLYLRDRLPKLTHQYNLPTQSVRLHSDPSFSLAAIAIPQGTIRHGLVRQMVSQRQIKTSLKDAAPQSSNRSISFSNLAIGSMGILVLCAGIGYTFYQSGNSTNTPSTKTTKPNQKPKPKQPSARPSAPPSVPSSGLEIASNTLIRTPKAGQYYSEDPQFSTSR
jgi:Caspase domain